MARFVYAVPFALTFALTACGSKSSSDTPDAPVINTTDAPPPDAAPPDAFACAPPLKECTAMACSDTTNDEANCSECGMACKGGEACNASKCACPTPGNFLPTDVQPDAMAQVQLITNFNIGIGFTPASLQAATELNGLLLVVPATTDLTKAYTISKTPSLLAPPVVLAPYNVVVGGGPLGFSADAYYVATGGTLKFDAACPSATGGQLKGTLTNATFTGATLDPTTFQITPDPAGCTFDVPSLTFDIRKKGDPACQ